MTSQFYNTDIFKAELPERKIHLIITSPPYNVGINYDVHKDNKPYKEYLEWLTSVFVDYLKNKLVDGGRLCINIAPTGVKNFTPIHHDLITALRKNGYTFVGEILWYKQNIKSRTAWGSFKSPRRPYVLPSWEYVYILQKGEFLDETAVKKIDGRSYAKPDITSKEFVKWTDGFWNILPETAKKGHPVPFPEELVYRLVKLYSYPGNMVLDPFGGSGTVAAVCAKTNRDSIYVDLSHEYFEIAKRRVKEVIEKGMNCPYCSGTDVEKRGVRLGKQRYFCKDCKKWWT